MNGEHSLYFLCKLFFFFFFFLKQYMANFSLVCDVVSTLRLNMLLREIFSIMNSFYLNARGISHVIHTSVHPRILFGFCYTG